LFTIKHINTIILIQTTQKKTEKMQQNSNKNIQIILFSIMTAILLLLIYFFKEIALLFFGSYVIACALNPIVDWLVKFMPRWAAITSLYILGFVVILMIAIPLGIVVIEEIGLFLDNLPTYISLGEKLLADLPRVNVSTQNLFDNFNFITQATTNLGGQILNQSLNFTKNILEGLTIIFTFSIIVLYMLLDKPLLKDGILSFFPVGIRDKAHSMGRAISLKIGGYVIGQILNMLAVGILTSLGLMIFGIKYAALLGLLAGLFDIIPIVGPILACGLAILVAIPGGLNSILAVIGVYFVAQWITNQFMKPVLFAKLLDLHPIIIILALLVAAQTLGVVGVILSPAIAATVCVIFQEVYLKVINKE